MYIGNSCLNKNSRCTIFSGGWRGIFQISGNEEFIETQLSRSRWTNALFKNSLQIKNWIEAEYLQIFLYERHSPSRTPSKIHSQPYSPRSRLQIRKKSLPISSGASPGRNKFVIEKASSASLPAVSVSRLIKVSSLFPTVLRRTVTARLCRRNYSSRPDATRLDGEGRNSWQQFRSLGGEVLKNPEGERHPWRTGTATGSGPGCFGPAGEIRSRIGRPRYFA